MLDDGPIMAAKQIGATALALVLTVGMSPLAAGQQAAGAGVLGGRATDEARRPYSNYVVQLRDVATGELVTTTPLDEQGSYRFDGLDLQRPFLVELFNSPTRVVVCTEGPVVLTTAVPALPTQNIDCGMSPAAVWLVGAAAAAAAGAVVGLAIQSGSQ